MIEKCYGEALWGADVFTALLNEADMTLWLKKDSSDEKLSLDQFGSIDFGLPKTTQNVASTGGLAGGYYDGRPTYKNRVFTLTTFFAGDNTHKALDADRVEMMRKWFVYDPHYKMWLYWNVKQWGRIFRIEVRPSIQSEVYKNLYLADNVKVTLTAEKPYFEATEEDVLTYTSDDDLVINNRGYEVPFCLKWKPTENAARLLVRSNRGFGFEAYGKLVGGYEYIFDGRESKCYENDIEKPSLISSGSFFTLKPGLNILSIGSTAPAHITVISRERIL